MSPSELLKGLRSTGCCSTSAAGAHRSGTARCRHASSGAHLAHRGACLWERLAVFAGGFEMDAIQHVAADVDTSATPDSIPASCRPSWTSRSSPSSCARSFSIPDARGAPAVRAGALGVGRFAQERATCAPRLLRRPPGPRRCGLDELAAGRLDRRVRPEEANLRLALEFCCTEPGEATAGLELASRLRKYALAYGALSEVRGWLHRLLPWCRNTASPDFGVCVQRAGSLRCKATGRLPSPSWPKPAK